MDREKPPHPWSDGTREPRRVLSREPDRELLGPLLPEPADGQAPDKRAASQASDATPDEAFRPPKPKRTRAAPAEAPATSPPPVEPSHGV